jgi:hypothetical protein
MLMRIMGVLLRWPRFFVACSWRALRCVRVPMMIVVMRILGLFLRGGALYTEITHTPDAKGEPYHDQGSQ